MIIKNYNLNNLNLKNYKFSLKTIFIPFKHVRFKVNKVFILCHNITGGGEGLVCSHIYACRKKYGEVKILKWDYGLGKKNDNL